MLQQTEGSCKIRAVNMVPTRLAASFTRRSVLQAALPAFALFPPDLRASAARVPISDMHSHYGMLTRSSLPSTEFAAALRAQRVALIAWALPSDLRWIHAVDTGVEQLREPAPGEMSAFFRERLDRMRTYVERSGLRLVLKPSDVDACVAGESGVVLASEGSDFLEGRLADLPTFHAKGLRHLQLVHYIKNPIGDFQTVAPRHGGLSDAGKRLVEACNDRGILVDLAHCTWAGVEQALDIAKKPLVWSHSWVDRTEGHWQDRYGHLQRRISLAQARKVANRGGVIGLWGLGLSKPGPSRDPGAGNWTVARGDTRGYAREIVNLINWLGAEHVGIGTDIEGVGMNWSVNTYGDVRAVVDSLQDMKVPSRSIELVACQNYARVLKSALQG